MRNTTGIVLTCIRVLCLLVLAFVLGCVCNRPEVGPGSTTVGAVVHGAAANKLEKLSANYGEYALTFSYMDSDEVSSRLESLVGLNITSLSLWGVDSHKLKLLDRLPLETLSLKGSVYDVNMLNSLQLSSLQIECWDHSDLSEITPLRGMHLLSLVLPYAAVTNLAPLQGMPLTNLVLGTSSEELDLHSLKGLPLRRLWVGARRLKGLDALNEMPLRDLHLSGKTDDLGPLGGLPLNALSLYGTGIVDLSVLAALPLRKLSLLQEPGATNLMPLSGLPLCELTILDWSNGKATVDLSPLHGMPLTKLVLQTNIKDGDLSSLKGMPLRNLVLRCSLVKDLSPLQKMPLDELYITGCAVTNLSALKGMSLTSLDIGGTVSDLSPLIGMPLQQLSIKTASVRDISPLKGMPLRNLDLVGSIVDDLSPLEGMHLKSLDFEPNIATKGLGVVRNMKSLQFICGTDPKSFWQQVDDGKWPIPRGRPEVP